MLFFNPCIAREMLVVVSRGPLQKSFTRTLTLGSSNRCHLGTWKSVVSHYNTGASRFKSIKVQERMIKRWISQGLLPVRGKGLYGQAQTADSPNHAYVALGSNVGNRIENIENALQAMMQRGLKVKRVSNLYETKAMYYENQDSFLNGACQVETDLEPLALLDTLQDVEQSLGRIKLVDKGPRNIDLDIILYGQWAVNHERLEIPHKLMLEREFVLKPLLDIALGDNLPLPTGGYESLVQSLQSLEDNTPGSRPHCITILDERHAFIKATDPTRPSHVMAILNVTPDSFSDGGVYDKKSLLEIAATVRQFIANGATIVDIGGQSTRPNADLLAPDQELSRILPVIEHIRSMPEAQSLVISVDTFYAKVAKGAILAGADIINDVSGGLLDKDMLPTVANLGKSIILMHMRGTPHTMTKLTSYPAGLLNEVSAELQARVEAAEAAGIFRWRIILDPGIGFAKTQSQNLELLRRMNELREVPALKGLPWLVGTSRKGFIGKITGVQSAGERIWGTAAAVTASIAGGADIIRVHDVAEMTQVAKMADAIYRNSD